MNKNLLNNLVANKQEELNAAQIKEAANAKKLKSQNIWDFVKNGNLRTIRVLGIAIGGAVSDADEKAMKKLFYGLLDGELTKDKVMPTVNKLYMLMATGEDLKDAGVKDVEFVDIVKDGEVVATYILKGRTAYDFEMKPIATASDRIRDEYVVEELNDLVLKAIC